MQANSGKNDPRRRVLRVLREAGDWVSGEALADDMGISRAAIGKHVAQLRREGNLIQSSTRKGFLLRAEAEPIEPPLVAASLTTAFLGRMRWLSLGETTSTNTEAAELALDGAEAGTVVTAEVQSRGKGRRGHAWYSTPRGLQFSVVLRPAGKGADSRSLTGKAQRALIGALKALAPVAPVAKPPNDLLVNGRKIAGILVETGLRGDEVDWLVLGVGCNVNAAPEEFPPGIAAAVTSVLAESGAVISRNRLLAEFFNLLEQSL